MGAEFAVRVTVTSDRVNVLLEGIVVLVFMDPVSFFLVGYELQRVNYDQGERAIFRVGDVSRFLDGSDKAWTVFFTAKDGAAIRDVAVRSPPVVVYHDPSGLVYVFLGRVVRELVQVGSDAIVIFVLFMWFVSSNLDVIGGIFADDGDFLPLANIVVEGRANAVQVYRQRDFTMSAIWGEAYDVRPRFYPGDRDGSFDQPNAVILVFGGELLDRFEDGDYRLKVGVLCCFVCYVPKCVLVLDHVMCFILCRSSQAMLFGRRVIVGYPRGARVNFRLYRLIFRRLISLNSHDRCQVYFLRGGVDLAGMFMAIAVAVGARINDVSVQVVMFKEISVPGSRLVARAHPKVFRDSRVRTIGP